MKIQLDYDKKVITLEKNANLGVFVSRIKYILPDWEEWELDTKTDIVWNERVVYKESRSQHLRPWYRSVSPLPDNFTLRPYCEPPLTVITSKSSTARMDGIDTLTTGSTFNAFDSSRQEEIKGVLQMEILE